MEILWAALILLGVGALLGLALAIAAVVLRVKEDERIEEVARLLRLDQEGYPYMSALEMIEGDYFWVISWDD